jgi:tRNA (guanine-N7-)-methyltransferase
MDAEASLIHRPASWVDPLPLADLFSPSRPLEIELGSGDGSFLAQWASLHRDRNFLGVERLLGRLRKLDRKGRRLGLDNLRLLRIEASYFLQYLLPPASVSALHLYFPDPWPKRKHRKNRLVTADFAHASHRILTSGGLVHLRTDDEDYFQQMRSVFDTDARFVAEETPAELAAVVTDFERQFNAEGIATRAASYRHVS